MAERPDSFFPQLFSLYTLSFIFSLLLVSLSGGRKEREKGGSRYRERRLSGTLGWQ